MLQLLQWQKRRAGRLGTHWVLKAPRHLSFLPALFAVFPDARILLTHRDPLETIPSISSLYASLWKLACDSPDPAHIGRCCKEHYARALRQCMQDRDAMPEDRFLDVDYREVLRDPLVQVRRIYAFLGLELADVHRRDRRAPHVYSLEAFGFTEGELQHDFREYRRRHIRNAL